MRCKVRRTREVFEEWKGQGVFEGATGGEVNDGCGLPAAGRVQIPFPAPEFCSGRSLDRQEGENSKRRADNRNRADAVGSCSLIAVIC